MTDPIPLVLKVEHWPQADRSAWESLFAAGDLFEEAGACRGWTEGSRTKRAQGYGQWLSFLLRTDAAAISLPPADRITERRARAYLEECEARLKPRSIEGLFADLLSVGRAIDPARDWDWLRITGNRLLSRANRKALPPPINLTAREIFHWSLRRMAEVEDEATASPMQRALLFRQALVIGFLIARPVRRRALLAMRVEHHLVPVAEGFDVRFTGADMKDGRARSFLLPADLVEPMRHYLTTHRPILLGGNSYPFLWISSRGLPLTPDGFARDLPTITRTHLGVALRPHAFRHIAATSIAEADPEHANIIRDLLGHATLDMSERHYNRATGLSSCNRVQSIVEDIRSRMPRIGRAGSSTSRPRAAR